MVLVGERNDYEPSEIGGISVRQGILHLLKKYCKYATVVMIGCLQRLGLSMESEGD